MINLQNLSYWEKETFVQNSDYLIIGSGIVGLSTAIYLKKRELGKKVTVLERGFLPTGASTKNAGFSCIGSPSEFLDDLKKNTPDKVFSIVDKRWRGLLNLNELLGTRNIGYESLGSHELFRPSDNKVHQTCMDHLDYFNKELSVITGKPLVFSPADKICAEYGFQGFNKAIASAAEGQIDTGKMMNSLLQLARSEGVNILNGITVDAVENKVLKTNYGLMGFEKLMICTNGFSKRFLPSEDVEPARAQVVVTAPIKDLKLKGIFHFDAGYYYFRNVGDRILFGGGRNLDMEGERTEDMVNTDKIINKLQEILRKQIIPYAEFEVEHQWAGTMGVGASKEPIVKQVDKDIFCGIRLGGMGVAIGSLIGKELAAMVLES